MKNNIAERIVSIAVVLVVVALAIVGIVTTRANKMAYAENYADWLNHSQKILVEIIPDRGYSAYYAEYGQYSQKWGIDGPTYTRKIRELNGDEPLQKGGYVFVLVEAEDRYCR